MALGVVAASDTDRLRTDNRNRSDVRVTELRGLGAVGLGDVDVEEPRRAVPVRLDLAQATRVNERRVVRHLLEHEVSGEHRHLPEVGLDEVPQAVVQVRLTADDAVR